MPGGPWPPGIHPENLALEDATMNTESLRQQELEPEIFGLALLYAAMILGANFFVSFGLL